MQTNPKRLRKAIYNSLKELPFLSYARDSWREGHYGFAIFEFILFITLTAFFLFFTASCLAGIALVISKINIYELLYFGGIGTLALAILSSIFYALVVYDPEGDTEN